jgi:nucleoside-diphosphate-sugar epimerase
MGDEARRVIVTGAAGFLGYHLAQRLIRQGVEVLGIDNLNNYYDPALKQARPVVRARCRRYSAWHWGNPRNLHTVRRLAPYLRRTSRLEHFRVSPNRENAPGL